MLLSPVITGTVTSLANGPRGTLIVSVSIIKAYKTGRLTITQVGETMSVKLVSQCKKCPLLRRGIAILDTHVHKRQIIIIFIYSKILINLCGLFLFYFATGANYIIMGQVTAEGRGTLEPGAFTATYKAPHHQLLMNINNQPC